MNDMTLVLAEILASKPHQVRKRWLKDRAYKEQGKKFDRDSMNIDVSNIIDKLNKKINGCGDKI